MRDQQAPPGPERVEQAGDILDQMLDLVGFDAFRDSAIDKSRFTDEAVEPFRRNALVPGAATAMVNYYRANFPGLGRYGNGPRIEVPTLMVWGEEDIAIGIEFTQNYEPFVADLTLERLPGVSHWVQQEAPEAVNGHIEAWMKLKGLA